MQLPTIDLHDSASIQEALSALDTGLFLLFKKGEREVRVIHGIGTGKLAGAVHESLEKNPMVVGRKEAADGGSCVVFL